MTNFILGLLFLPTCYLVYHLVGSAIYLWGSVRKYGGENPRILTWFGKRVQKLFQKIQGKPVDRPRTSSAANPL